MPREIDPKRTGSLLVKIVAAGAIGALPHAVHTPVIAETDTNFFRENAITSNLDIPQEHDLPKLAKELSKNSQLSDVLEKREMRAVIGALFFTTLASLYLTYQRSKKYDDDLLKNMKVSASFLALCSVVSLGVDSFTAIDRHIPASLFAGGLFIQAGANLMDVYQRDKRSDIRAGAWATSIGLVSFGLALLYAADKV